jgi:hypothetical protein
MKLTKILLAGAFATFLGAAAASAQTPPPTPEQPAPTDAAKKLKSADCSAQANKLGLHGKERRRFRAKCLRAK